MMQNHDVLDAKEAALFMRTHVETVRRLARKGAIPAFKVGKDWRFRRGSLERWADSHEMKQQAATVLVVDDEEEFRKVLRGMLEPAGYRVLEASDGTEGLRRVDNDSPDLVLLDLKMPGMDGPEFLGRLRQNRPDIPVVIVTGYPDSDLMMEAMHYGPLLLEAKPVERTRLLRTLKTVLNKGR